MWDLLTRIPDHSRPLTGASARRAALLGAVSATVATVAEDKAEAFGKNPSDWLGYYKDSGGC